MFPRMFKSGNKSGSKSSGTDEDDAHVAYQRRREQVRKAQRLVYPPLWHNLLTGRGLLSAPTNVDQHIDVSGVKKAP